MNYVLIAILICFSAFFSGTEIAYTSVNRARIKKLADDGNRVAGLACRIYDRFDKSLAAILIGNNFVNIAASAVCTTIAIGISGGTGTGAAAAIATAVITVLILIFGEIVPKVVSKQNSEKIACIAAYPLMFFTVIFSPITFFVSVLLKLCEKIWGKTDNTVTEKELATIIEATEQDGGIDEEKSDLLQSALEFSEITLAEIITHRTEVVALDIDDSAEKNFAVINSSKYSRLPVYRDNMDNIVGILNINQFYKMYAENRDISISDVMLEPMMLYGTTKLPAALEEMREKQVQMVVVLDEYGGTLGVVTMEDILEQIVGDIWDESDDIVIDIAEISDGCYRVLGETGIYDMFDELDVDDRDFESDCNTVGGWCVEVLEQNPEVGMEFTWKNLHVEIVKVEELCVAEVKVTVLPLDDGDGKEDE